MKELSGIEEIAKERDRQLKKLGWSKHHDKTVHVLGELAEIAAFFAAPSQSVRISENQVIKVVREFDWDITPHDRINELAKAGALIAAEIDRLKAKK